MFQYFQLLCVFVIYGNYDFVIVSAQILPNKSNPPKFLYYGSGPSPDPGVELFIPPPQSTISQKLRPNTETTFIIDGFLSTGQSPMSQRTKDAILQHDPSSNVIIVDWGATSGSGAAIIAGNLARTAETYGTALRGVGPVAETIAEFVQHLKLSYAVSPSQIHIIGHSLGAHVAGAAGYWSKKRFGNTLGRITGLDPAGPGFTGGLNPDKRLEKSDAGFVDIYHSNRNTLGDRDHRLGHVDIYINGGDNQPGCSGSTQKAICSHLYSWKIFDVTYSRELRACPCSGFECQCNSGCRSNCPNSIPIGTNIPERARGAYHVVVEDEL